MTRTVLARIRGRVRSCTLVRETPKRYLVSVFYPSTRRTEQTWVAKAADEAEVNGRYTKVGFLVPQS